MVDANPVRLTSQAVEGPTAQMSPAYRELVVRLIRDNWAAEAANLSLPQHAQACPLHLAPTVQDRAILAGYWADECRHAVIFSDLLRDLGCEPAIEDYDALRPAELLRLPIETWAEFGLFQLFADSAGVVHLGDYRDCSYLPLQAAAMQILRDEVRHVALGVKNLTSGLQLPDGRDKALSVLPVWYGAAMELFGRVDRPSRRAQALVDAGLRRSLNEDLRKTYCERVDRQLVQLGLPVPA